MKQGKTLERLGAELQRQRTARADFIADTRQLNFSTENNKSRITFENGGKTMDFGINPLATSVPSFSPISAKRFSSAVKSSLAIISALAASFAIEFSGNFSAENFSMDVYGVIVKDNITTSVSSAVVGYPLYAVFV